MENENESDNQTSTLAHPHFIYPKEVYEGGAH